MHGEWLDARVSYKCLTPSQPVLISQGDGLPEDILRGQLANSTRPVCHPSPLFKDTCKRDLKACSIRPNCREEPEEACCGSPGNLLILIHLRHVPPTHLRPPALSGTYSTLYTCSKRNGDCCSFVHWSAQPQQTVARPFMKATLQGASSMISGDKADSAW